MKITVMSFNVQHCQNYITREIDYDVMAKAITDCGADIIGLNEIRDAGKDEGFEPQVQTLAAKLGYYYYFAKAIDVGEAPNPYGNALLSRFPIESAITVPVPDPDPATRIKGKYYESRCVLKAKIGELTVCICHFGLNPDEQENAVKAVMGQIEDTHCVLMGDFNVKPQNPVLQPIREAMFDTADLFGCELLSFPSDEPKVKIDYMFTSRDLNVLSADIPAIVASDHRPYVAQMEI